MRQSLRVSKVLCYVTLVFPVLTTLGWIFGIALLTQGHPALPAMQPNTAAGLAICALAVLVTPERPSTNRRTAAALLLASIVLLLGLLTLGEYTFAWDLGMDRIFAHGAPTAMQPFPGRPSPQTALNFALLGAVLISVNVGVWPLYVWQTGAIVTAANSIAAATGYIFSTHTLYGFPLHTPAIGMAVHTAVAFVLIVVAVFCRRPNDGMMTLVTSDTQSGAIARRILVAGIVAPPLVGALTRVGVAAGWYDAPAQASLFVLIMAGLILRTTWRTARRSEHDERQAQAALEALEHANEQLTLAIGERELFAALVQNSSDFIGIADAAGTPVYLNPAGRRMVGLDPDVPVGDIAILDCYTPEQRAFASDVILKSMLEHGHWEGETAFRHWQTEVAIPVWDTHFIIREPHTGRFIGHGTITRDMSAIKQAREDLELANRRLAQANDEITLLLDKVTRLDELKTRFFANVSHELRTPLTLILGPIDKHLQATDLDLDLRRDLEVVERNARTVLRHVNDLLDVARIDAGRLKLEYSETDAAALVGVVTDHFSALAREANIAFVVEAPSALPVQTDSAKVQRILLNLLSNAFKFTPGGGRVRVTLRAAGPRFRVEVGDSGPGIPIAKREEVFERFRQLEGDTVHPRAGTGLGLSIVREFAVLLGGTVSVSDAPEGGALFLLDVPSAAPSGTAVRPSGGERVDAREVERLVHELRTTGAAAGADHEASEGREGRVLVVEDNRDMSAFIADTLRSDGFDVSLAYDGQQGFDKAVAEHPDLVLTDIMMPKVSGDELVRLLRQQPELSSTPIVVLTARADQGFRVGLLREGVQDYLDKPFSVPELRARVRNLVARRRAEEHLNHLRRQLEAVALASTQISEAVASLPEESVRAVFQTIALNAQNLTGAEFAAAGMGGDATHPFEIWASVGMSPEMMAKIGQPPRPLGLLGLVLKENRTVRLRDLREHAEHHGYPADHPEMKSFLGVPIRYRGRAVGNLYLSNKVGGAEFTVDDQQVVEMLAERAGAAIETARLYAAEGREHAWLQAVVDQMPEGIVLMDAKGRVTVENRSLRMLTNARPPVPDRFGNPMTIDLRLPSGEQLPLNDFPIVKAILDLEATRGRELIGRRADGRLVPLLVSATPIVTPQGTLAGAAMVFQDISAIKELERLREEWASIVAHDLRQPISVITLRSSLLLRGQLSDEQLDDVRQISASAQRLSRMTKDLMDASLLETRRMRVTLDRLDVGQLLRDVVERVPLAAARTKTRTPADSRLYIKGDAQRLEQVVANLLSNAVKYGAPDTEISLEARQAEGNAEILVTNRGTGIPPEDVPLLFERYVRSREARASATEGTGLGLYIAKGLVEAHGGRIWVDSVPNDLTTFHVTIPLDGPPVAAAALPPANTTGAHTASQAERP